MAYKAKAVTNLPTLEEQKATIRKNVADSMKKTGTSVESTHQAQKENPAIKMQKKKEDAAEAALPSETERKANSAKKALEEYLASDERKAWEKKQQDGKFAQSLLFGTPADQQPDVADQKEKQLKKEADYWAGKATAEREAKIQERDTKAAESWDDADKEELERYIQNRQSAFVQSLSPAATGLPAEYEDSYLIEKYGRQRLDEIASSYQKQKNAEKKQMQEQRGRDMVNSGAIGTIGANAASIGTNLADTLLNPLERIANMAGGKDDRYSTIDPNAGGSAAAFTSGVRDQTAKNIAGSEEGIQLSDGITGRELLALGYQGGMSALDTAARSYVSLVPKGGSTIIGAGLAAMGSFNQTLADASAKGATPQQAIALATTTAGIEALTEKIPMDELLKVAKAGGKAPAKVFMNVLKQMGVEIAEEEASLIGTTLAEAAILREKSSFNQQIMEAVAAGVPIEEAKAAAYQAILEEAKQTAIVSGIAGGFGAAGAEIKAAKYGGMDGSQQIQEGTQTEQTAADNPTQVIEEQSVQEEAPQSDMAASWMENGFREVKGGNTKTAAQNDSGWNKLRKYTQHEMENWKTSKRIVLCDNIEHLRQFVTNALTSQTQTHKKMYFGAITADLAAEIKNATGVNVEDYNLSLGEDEIRKIKKSHGNESKESLRGQRAVTEADYLAIPDIVQNADSINRSDTDYEGKPAIEFRKRNGNEVTTVVAVVSDKRLDVFVQTAYINKKAGSIATPEPVQAGSFTPEAPGGTAPISGDVTQTPAEGQVTNRETNARSDFASPSPNNRIAENSPKVNDNVGSTQQVDTYEPSAEGGQVKGTGAAEADFSGKPSYNATLSADNAQADRATDVRPMELPRQDVNGGNISATTANVYGSQNTPDDLASAMEEPVARGDFSYIRITNDEATSRAQKTIEKSGGWERAKEDFHLEVDRGQAGAELSARGALILNHYGEIYQQAKAGGNETEIKKTQRDWLNILADVRKLGTNTAQGLQAMKIIRNLMPQDKLEFAKAAVHNMVRDMKLNVDIEIDQNLLNEYENAATDEQRDKVLEKIQQNVADQIPSTILDKWNALRYTNMLGNLKTNVRNIAGNVGNNLVYGFKDTVAASVEAVANKATKGKIGRTKSVIVNKNIQNACGKYYDQVKTAVSSGSKYNDSTASDDFTQGVMDKRRIFKSDNKILNAAMMPMEEYRKGTTWMMNNEYFGDEAFGKAAFTRAMAGYLQANGVKPGTDLSTVDSALMDKAMAHAVKEAQEATFHDNSALAKVFGGLKKEARIVGEAIAPFTKTPANVLTRAEEYSPLGIINTAVMAAKKAGGNTDITGTDIINSLSKTLTGSMIFALGAAMYSGGILNGGPDEDEDKAAFDKLNGIQDYSINLPDGSTYTLDWLTPAAMPMFMGAQLMKIAQEKDGFTFADLEQVFTSIADPMLQMSMLSGINDSLDNIKDSDNNLGQFFINAAVSYLMQGLTNTLLGQIEKSTEKTRQTTYIDKDSETPVWLQKQLGKASQKIPGWDYQQTDYINAKGENEEQRTDAVGWLYNLVSPGYVKKKQIDDVAKELYRLNEAGVEGNVFPESPSTTITYTDKSGTVHKDYHLTAEEAETLKRETGKETMRIVEDITKAKDYDAMTDAQKVKAIEQAEAYARERAEIAALEDHTGYSDPWMEKMTEGREADYIIRRVTNSDLTNAMEALTIAWEKGYDTTSRSNNLEWAYKTFEGMSLAGKNDVKEWVTGSAARYIEAREKGISHEKYLDVAKLLDGIKPEKGYSGARSVQKAETIAKAKGLTESQKEMLVKQQVSDSQDRNIDELKTLCKNLDGVSYSTQLYVKLYRDHEDYTSGYGKKDRTVEKWMKEYGISKKAAKKLYEVFS